MQYCVRLSVLVRSLHLLARIDCWSEVDYKAMLVFNISILAYSFVVRFSSVLKKKGRRRKTVGVNTVHCCCFISSLHTFLFVGVCVCVCLRVCVFCCFCCSFSLLLLFFFFLFFEKGSDFRFGIWVQQYIFFGRVMGPATDNACIFCSLLHFRPVRRPFFFPTDDSHEEQLQFLGYIWDLLFELNPEANWDAFWLIASIQTLWA